MKLEKMFKIKEDDRLWAKRIIPRKDRWVRHSFRRSTPEDRDPRNDLFGKENS